MNEEPNVAIVGSAVVDLDTEGTRGRTHVLPADGTALRWHALFSSPFFHPTVLVDRETLDRHGLRYDPSFLESEDYDLWTRLFAFADGANLSEPLVAEARARRHRRRCGEATCSNPFSAGSRCARSRGSHQGSAKSKPSSRGVSAAAGVAPTKEAGHALLELLAAFERRAWPRSAGARGGRPCARCAAARSRDAARLVGRRRGSPACRRVTGDPRHGRLARADAVSRAALRPRRSGRRHRPHRDLRRALGRAPRVDGRAAAPSRLSARRFACREQSDCSATTIRSRRESAGALRHAPTGRRRRLGLEHVRVAGARSPGAALIVSRTCSWSRATTSARARAGAGRSRERSSRDSCARAANVLVVGSAARESVVARGAT